MQKLFTGLFFSAVALGTVCTAAPAEAQRYGHREPACPLNHHIPEASWACDSLKSRAYHSRERFRSYESRDSYDDRRRRDPCAGARTRRGHDKCLIAVAAARLAGTVVSIETMNAIEGY